MDITARLRGKIIAAVTTNGSKLRITCADGAEMDVMWVDENARPLRGRPMIGNFGVRLAAGGIKDILQPDLLSHATPGLVENWGRCHPPPDVTSDHRPSPTL